MDKLPLDYADPACATEPSALRGMSRGVCALNLLTTSVIFAAHVSRYDWLKGFAPLAFFWLYLTILFMSIPLLFGVVLPLAFPKALPADFLLPRRQCVEILIETAVLAASVVAAHLLVGPHFLRT